MTFVPVWLVISFQEKDGLWIFSSTSFLLYHLRCLKTGSLVLWMKSRISTVHSLPSFPKVCCDQRTRKKPALLQHIWCNLNLKSSTTSKSEPYQRKREQKFRIDHGTQNLLRPLFFIKNKFEGLVVYGGLGWLINAPFFKPTVFPPEAIQWQDPNSLRQCGVLSQKICRHLGHVEQSTKKCLISILPGTNNEFTLQKLMVGRWNFLLGWPAFRGYVCFRECN